MDNIVLYDLTQAQKRVLYTQMKYSNSPMFNIGGIVKFDGEIEVDLLKKAIYLYVIGNDAFHIHINQADEIMQQYFTKEDILEENIEYIELDDDSKFEMYFVNKLREPFDIFDKPLFSFSIFKEHSMKFGYFIKIHHAISDGWSMQLLSEGIADIYSSLINGDSIEYQYNAYKNMIENERKYLSSSAFETNKKFWNQVFSELPSTLKGNNKETQAIRETLILDKNETKLVRNYCKNNNISENIFFIIVYLIFLYRTTGNNDLVIGLPTLGRHNKNEKKTFGMFVSTMPFRLYISEGININELIKNAKNMYMQYYRHHKYPYNFLIKDMQKNDEYCNSLFNACVNYYNTKLCNNINGINISNYELFNGEQEYSIQTIIREWDNSGNIQIDIDYKTSEFTSVYIRSYKEAIIEIINQISYFDTLTVDSINIISENCNSIINKFNNTSNKKNSESTVIEQIKRSIKCNGHKIAVKYRDIEMTYAELEKRVLLLSNHLRKIGVKKGVPVCLLMKNSIETVISILSILEVGAFYIPIDVTYPLERIKFIIKDVNCDIILTNIETELYNDKLYHFIDVRDIEEACRKVLCWNNSHIKANDIAYIIYTSGSTGKPKGVIIEHGSLSNYIIWARKQYSKSPLDFPLYSSISFDLTITSIFLPIITGGKIVVYSNEEYSNVIEQIIKDNNCNAIKLTPSHLMLLKDINVFKSKLKVFILGGEQLFSKDVKMLCQKFSNNIEIYNEYGPTEATVGCMIYKYNSQKDKEGAIPIGCPIDNIKIYIMNKKREKLPYGVVGDLYIGGVGLARGYVNNVLLTSEKFIRRENGELLYNTGDRAYLLDEKTAVYVGRKDDQVKLLGHRIELGEVEKYLNNYSEIEKCCVTVLNDIDHKNTLCAYYTAKSVLIESDIRDFLSMYLPRYMIPTIYQFVKKLPLTNNGKINYSKLSLPNAIRTDLVDFEIKDGYEVFLKLLAILLNKNNLSYYDNFFYCGGDSIKAIQYISELSKIGYEISVSQILNNPIIGDMFKCIKKIDDKVELNKESGGVQQITPIMNWFIKQNFIDCNYYNQSCDLIFSYNIRKEVLEKVINYIIKNHPVFQMEYESKEQRFVYSDLIRSEKVCEYSIEKLSYEAQLDFIKHKKLELNKSIDLQKGILLKSALFNMSESKSIWFICINHLVIDPVSWRIILSEIDMLLTTKKYLNSDIISNEVVSYQQYSELFSKYEFLEDPRWEGIKDCSFPIELESGKALVMLQKQVDEIDVETLKLKATKSYSMQVDELLLCALYLAIRDMTNVKEFVIEVEGHGRDIFNEDINLLHTVGWFTTRYPIYLHDLGEDIGKIIKDIKKSYRISKEKYQNYLGYLQKKRETEPPMILFNYLGEINVLFDSFDVEINQWGKDVSPDNTTSNGIEINVCILYDKLHIEFRYNYSLYNNQMLHELCDRYVKAIKEVIGFCLNTSEINVYNSDFNNTDLSDEEFESLFM